ncbi:MAG: hypothetical protein ABEH83_14250 [Halobacterium sp.]
MDDLAAAVRDALEDGVSRGLVGVSYYDEEGVGHVYRSDWAAEKYEPPQVDAVVRDIQLGALGYGSLEARHEQDLHATVRVYDEMLDVAVPVSQMAGVVFPLDVDGDYALRAVIDRVESVIEESAYERPVID